MNRIQLCMTTHSSCRPKSKATFPTRILDILSSNSQTDVDLIKLVEDQKEPKAYVCLSYAWGKSQNLRTMKHTLEKHKSGIPLSSLSRTFQDAVHFVWRINVQYLWIDWMCIIQGDANDWARSPPKCATSSRIHT